MLTFLFDDRIVHAGDDLVVRHSWIQPAIGSVVALGVAIAVCWSGPRHGVPVPLAVGIALFALFFAALLAKTARLARAPWNWALAIGPTRVRVRLGNATMPGREVVEIPRADINLVRAWHITTRASRADEYSREHYVDIELRPGVDTARLSGILLGALRQRPTKGASLHQYPVSLLAGDTLRIQWRTSSVHLTPAIARAMIAFGPLAAPDVEQYVSFDSRRSDEPAAIDRLRALVLEGNDTRARRIALRDLRWSPERTRAFLRETRGSASMFD